MSFQVHPEGHATICGVPFCPGAKVRVFNEYRPAPDGACVCEPGTAIRGVQLDMANGLELSIMWGTINYCDARGNPNVALSETAEVALFDENRRRIGDVVGWVEAADVLALIPLVAATDPQHIDIRWDGRVIAADVRLTLEAIQ